MHDNPVPLPALLSKAEVASRCGVTARSIDNWLKADPTFPRPVHPGGSARPRWRAADLDAYLHGLQPAGGAA